MAAVTSRKVPPLPITDALADSACGALRVLSLRCSGGLDLADLPGLVEQPASGL
jgi:hypothetical protein